MLGQYSLGQAPLAARLDITDAPIGYEGFVDFQVLDTVISQYRDSPIIMALVQYMGAWLDGQVYDDFFYKNVWDLSQARDYGLDILGRIVGARRELSIPEPGTYIGFDGQPTAQNWGHGIWNRDASATANVRLEDDTYRRVILAKARANVSACTVQDLNAILMLLFPNYGNSYVKDNADETYILHFGTTISAVDYAIISQEGLLPRPAGRSFTIEQGP